MKEMIEIPIWLLIVLIASNTGTVCVVVGIIELICCIHDMIKVDVWYKKHKGEHKE